MTRIFRGCETFASQCTISNRKSGDYIITALYHGLFSGNICLLVCLCQWVSFYAWIWSYTLKLCTWVFQLYSHPSLKTCRCERVRWPSGIGLRSSVSGSGPPRLGSDSKGTPAFSRIVRDCGTQSHSGPHCAWLFPAQAHCPSAWQSRQKLLRYGWVSTCPAQWCPPNPFPFLLLKPPFLSWFLPWDWT